MHTPPPTAGAAPTDTKGKEMTTYAVLIYEIENGTILIEQTVSGFESKQAAEKWADSIEGEAQYSILEIDF
jgi:hypothetical protein